MNRAYETQLIATVNDISENLDAGKQTSDFSKVIDKLSFVFNW